MTKEEFKAGRLRLNMTQAELAEAMGYGTIMAISFKERGVRKVNARDEVILKQLLKKVKK